MNKRQLKKAMKKKGAEALVNQNEHLKRENTRLKQAIAEHVEGVKQIKRSFNANVGAIARLYGETIEGYSVIEIPMEEVRTVLDLYEVTCSIEGGKYIYCVLPKVDPEAK